MDEIAMFNEELIFYELDNGEYRLYQYFAERGINTNKLIIARGIKDKATAKFMAHALWHGLCNRRNL